MEEQTLLLIRDAFNQSPDNQTLLIAGVEVERFWEWFGNQATIFEALEVDTDKYNKPKEFTSGRCFGNSQITMLKNGLDYYEGFAKIGQSFIFHGFNVYKNIVIDVTAISNEEAFLDYQFGLPDTYYGIHISKEFTLRHNKEGLENNQMNISHLIYLLYLESKVDN